MDTSGILIALASLRDQRAALDFKERTLIESAREAGVGWAPIATALGLGSRQAAEQRLMRLSAGSGRDPAQARLSRQQQRIVDKPFGPAIVELRSAASKAHRHVAGVEGWDSLHPRAALVRVGLELAISAPPGSLFELVRQAVADSEPLSLDQVPAEVAQALQKLALTLEACTPRI